MENNKETKRRRDLLPWWMKIYIWIFLIFGLFAFTGLILGFFGVQFKLSLYGLYAYSPLSLLGLVIIATFLFKGTAAFGLLLEKDWAILFGQIDALLGIIICVIAMAVSPFINTDEGFNFSFRLELAFLIPFFIKLIRIKKNWLELEKN